MNILIVTDSYPPEIRSISLMIRELAEAMVQKGHQVTVATCWPEYNLSSDTSRDSFKPILLERGVRVFRIRTPPHHKVNFIIRGLAQLLLPYIFLRFIKKHLKQKIDVVVLYSPPLPLFQVGIELKKKQGSRLVLNVQDIFPQVAMDLGAMKHPLLIHFFEWMEMRAYTQADVITTHTQGNRQFLIENKKVSPAKISCVYNWIDLDSYKRAKATGEYCKEYGLEGKFILLFPGVLGPAQDLEFIIELARRLVDLPDLCFLFVGDGSERVKLENQAAGLPNVYFKTFVSQERYPALLKEADIGLVCLGLQNKISSIPGKVIGFMAASLPILAFLNKENEGHTVIREANCGYTLLPDDRAKAEKTIREIYHRRDKIGKFGENGYNYALSHFSKGSNIDKFLQLII